MRNPLNSYRRIERLLAIALALILVVLPLGSGPVYASTIHSAPEESALSTLQVNKTDGEEQLEGSYLTLRVKPANMVYWTTVEWQDGAGNWHLVEGWTGYTQNGSIRWYADKNLLGKGPFRWNVSTQDRCLIVPGVPFMLPKQRGATVVTSVNIWSCTSWTVTTNYLLP